ncbi:MAG TPA: helix-turn-helix transcriptional regulator [Acidimicrobiales bacterium]
MDGREGAMAGGAAGGEWPLVGREEELEYLARVRADGAPAVVVGGAPGVGRSRLAAEALVAARTERWAGERVDGTTATASIPFGGVAHLAPPGFAGGSDPLGLLLGIVDHVRARAARQRLFLIVDDAHLLDEASLAVVRRLVGVPSTFVLLTIRSDVPPPAPILGLWKDGHAPRLELQPLSRAETYTLVRLVEGGGEDGGAGAAQDGGAGAGGGARGPADGGDADPAIARRRWLWDHSLGNPLLLRELMSLGPDARRRAPDPGAAPAHRLDALVRHRLGELTDAERTVLDALVVGGPLPPAVVEELSPPTAVSALLGRGLIVDHDDGAEHTLALAHPAYDVVLRDRLTAGRTRALRRRLLDLLTATEAADPQSDPRAAVRLATLRLDQGGDVDADQLVVAARYAQAAFPRALAERLPADLSGDLGDVDDLTAAMAAATPSSRPSAHDLAVAERLARAAWDADRSLAAGLALTTVLVARGRGAEAAVLTDELAARAATPGERVQVALARAALHFWVLGEAAVATGILDDGESDTDDPALLGRLRRLRAGIALNVGRVEEAAALAAELIAAEHLAPGGADGAAGVTGAAGAIGPKPGGAAGTGAAGGTGADGDGGSEHSAANAGSALVGAEDAAAAAGAAGATGPKPGGAAGTGAAGGTPVAALAAATGTAALALAGRPAEAVGLADRFLPVAVAHTEQIPEVLGQLMLGRLFAVRVLGRIEEAERLAYLCYQPAAEQGSLTGMAVFTAALGQIALDRGQPAVAARRLREADVLLAEYDSFGYRPWVLAGLTTAHALAGDVPAARAARDRMRTAIRQPRYFDPELDLAEAWCWAADGAIEEAAAAAGRAAERARASGLAPFEAAALHALVRLGRPGGAAERLAALATATASPLVELYARHASAAQAGDGPGLEAVAGSFEEVGALLLAAEAASQAAAAHHRAGRAAKAERAAGRSRTLLEACRGAASPALRSSGGIPSLTDRERQVAALAARGLTTPAIAERLVVSPRTVESHLYRIFAKLGIRDRSELADLL